MDPMLERPPKEMALVETVKSMLSSCLYVGQSSSDLALFSVDMYFRANITIIHHVIHCCVEICS